MKVLFLDIDGVLNHGYMLTLSRDAIARLNKLIDATGAKVILSSSWRYTFDHAIAQLYYYGLRAGVVIDRTCLKSEKAFATRGEEIKWWLECHPDVTSFCALDDDEDLSTIEPNCVRTDSLYGLLDEHIELALKILGGEE